MAVYGFKISKGFKMTDDKKVDQEILKEVHSGLTKKHKQLPSKLFYDEKGSHLFDKICELNEYYPTRTEMKIMDNNISEITEMLGSNILLVELGSGSSLKTRLLLSNLKNIAAYIPVDISAEHLMQSADSLQKEYPELEIHPLVADYTKQFSLPEINKKFSRIVAYYPGSTIGNFYPAEAKNFIERISNLCGKNGALLIGVDLKKNRDILEAAYNDAEGVTAEFNLNMLCRLNKDISSNFNPEAFKHFAFYNEQEGRIEMHLISKEEQDVRINGSVIHFLKGENILTEYSYKYSPQDFKKLLSGFFEVKKIWMDEDQLFSVQYCEKL